LVVPIGFTCENLETVYEIDIEYIKDLADNIYDRVERVPCPDD
jgi:protoheme ferro-lyase